MKKNRKEMDFFKPHLFIEFFYGHDKMFLSEHMSLRENYHLLLEEYGVFNGCEKMAEQLTDKLNGFKKWGQIISVSFNSEWVNKINLYSTQGVGEAAYEADNGIWNNNLKKFDEITIDLNVNNIDSDDFFPLIMHELTHAYQDYNLRLNGSSLINNLKKLGVNKNQTVKIDTYEETKRKLAWVLYHLNDFERSSYIAQIDGYLENTTKLFRNIKEVLDFMKSTTAYKNYQTIFEWIDDLCNIEDGKKMSEMLKYVEKLSNLEFLSYDKFKRWLRNKQWKYQYKFNTVLPKLAYKHLNMVEYVSPTVNYLIT
jgi:hypothetical protein